MWLFRYDKSDHDLPHKEHKYGFSAVCLLKWLLRLPEEENDLVQSEQL
jgi:hypothetical protein